jgi:Fe-S cluster assembly protein SufD
MAGAPTHVVRSYLADYDRLQRDRPLEPPELQAARQAAMRAFAASGMPSRRTEAWRQTELGRLDIQPYEAAAGPPPGIPDPIIEAFRLAGSDRLVFVDGRFSPDLSETPHLTAGGFAGSLADGLTYTPELAIDHFGRLATPKGRPLVALNTGLMRDGALVIIPQRVTVSRPIHIMCITSDQGEMRSSYPRHLIVVNNGSKCTIVETYIGEKRHPYFTCPVTELFVGHDAKVGYYRWQEESDAACHMANVLVQVDHHARLEAHGISLGGLVVRQDTNADLSGEGSECVLNGLYLAAGTQFVDNHMLVRHLQPRCTSRELYKGILDGSARAVFNGRIYVQPGAQKTDAKQSNRNLLLSDAALVSSNPQLEIFADDVRCTHGSAVGQMDDDALFYLRSRGLDRNAARAMLVYAFAGEILDEMSWAPIRQRLEDRLADRLPQGKVIREMAQLRSTEPSAETS